MKFCQTHIAQSHIGLRSIRPCKNTNLYLYVHRHMNRVLNRYRLQTNGSRTNHQNQTTHATDIRPQAVRLLLTFTGGPVESITALLAGHAPETCVTGTGTVTEVTVIAFTMVTAERADSTWTRWTEREQNIREFNQIRLTNDVMCPLTYS